MESYTIKKSELLDFYNRNTTKSIQENRVKLPNEDVSVRISKVNVEDYIENGDDHKGWIEIVSAHRKSPKIFKVTQDQFGILLLTLMSKKVEKKDK